MGLKQNNLFRKWPAMNLFGRFGHVFGLLMILAVLWGCSGGGGSDSGDIRTSRPSVAFDRIVVNHYSDTPVTIRNQLNRNLTVGQVSYAVGFSDAQYFDRVFKKFFNCTPVEYRLSSVSKKERIKQRGLSSLLTIC